VPQCADESDKALRSSRLLVGAEEAGRGRSASRGEEARNHPGSGDGAGLRAHPRSTPGSDRRDASPLSHEATVLELLRAGNRDKIEFGLGPSSRRRLDQGARSTDPRALAPTQSLLEEHLQGRSNDSDHTMQQRPHPCALRAAPRWRHQAHAREAELGAHDRSDGAADVEGRGGIRPRTRRSIDSHARRLGEGSIGGVGEKAIIRVRSREQCSHATLCVAAEESIHILPGLRLTAWRSCA